MVNDQSFRQLLVVAVVTIGISGVIYLGHVRGIDNRLE